MSHLRLTTSEEVADDAPPGPGAMRFASFTPMNDQPGLADRKATFVIGAGGLLLSTTMFLVMPLGQFVRPGFWPRLTLVAGARPGVRDAAGDPHRLPLLHAGRAGPRRTTRCSSRTSPPARRRAYAQALEAATARDALRDVLDYNYTMARLGAAKYRLAGRALLCLRIAIPLWMLLLILVTAQSV